MDISVSKNEAAQLGKYIHFVTMLIKQLDEGIISAYMRSISKEDHADLLSMINKFCEIETGKEAI